MKLYEYQAKILFQKSGITVPNGHLVTDLSQVQPLMHTLRFPVMVKGQVLSGGRAKHDAIKTVYTFEQTQQTVAMLLNSHVDGLPIPSVLIEDHINSHTHYYVSVVNDRNARKPVLVASVRWGGDIEEIAQQHPQEIAKQHIDPLTGLHAYQSLQIADALNFPKHLWRKFDELAQSLYQCYVQYDATLVEVNPIAYTHDHGFVAIDAKMKVDDNALYRQPDITIWQDTLFMTETERLAHDAGVSYVKLDGQIGCVVNGAALAMTMMDMTHSHGDGSITPACFLDIGGGADAERIENALKIVFSDPAIKAVVCSIFGGMTRCDEIASGIVHAYRTHQPNIKTIVRLQGTNALHGWEIIQSANLPNLQMADSLTDALHLAINAVKGYAK